MSINMQIVAALLSHWYNATNIIDNYYKYRMQNKSYWLNKTDDITQATQNEWL